MNFLSEFRDKFEKIKRINDICRFVICNNFVCQIFETDEKKSIFSSLIHSPPTLQHEQHGDGIPRELSRDPAGHQGGRGADGAARG